MSLFRRAAGNLALVLGGIVVALLIAAAGLRIANHWYPYFFRFDSAAGWNLRPGASGYYGREGGSYVRINRGGFRGPERPLAKPPGTFRVAMLGDSYTEAIQVPYEQTFSAVTERRLSSCPALAGRHVEVLDFGVDGYGTTQELVTLRKQALAYSPDAVVLAIFLGNDIRNNSVVLEGNQCRPFDALEDGKLVPVGPFFDSPSFRLWCMARFNYRDAALTDLFSQAWTIIRHHPSGPTLENPVERAINYNIYKPPSDKAWRDAWDVTDALVVKVRDVSVAHHAMFLAVTLDTGVQVLPEAAMREKFMRWQKITDLFYPDEQIEALGRREDFAVLALAPSLQKYAEAHDVYLHGFKNTPMGFGHWNAVGHQQAGELIAARLCAMIGKGHGH
ncbi:MAG TPA: SGNH/GDSL hydrolase family protein [Candidatus Binataceae bacterium]|nr:SGNH/GDSL hydrolase family protein [Candidatus Binataceae bacterium]